MTAKRRAIVPPANRIMVGTERTSNSAANSGLRPASTLKIVAVPRKCAAIVSRQGCLHAAGAAPARVETYEDGMIGIDDRGFEGRGA